MRLSRRALLRSALAGGSGLIAAYTVGCGDGEDGAAAPTATLGATAPGPTATAAPGASTLRWRQLATDVDAPSPRRDHALVTDGERLVLFGGRDPSPLGDTWVYAIASNKWEQPIADLAPPARFGHNAVWDLSSNRILVFGGQAGAGFFDDLWAFDPETWQWSELPANGSAPNARYGAGGAIDPAGRLLVTHGFTTEGRFDDTWAYNLDGPFWDDVSPSGVRPVERCLMRAVWDPAARRLLMFGGQTTGTPFLGDFWALAEDGWTELVLDPSPSPRNFYAMVFDAANATSLLFGGDTAEGETNDLWVFHAARDQWSPLAVEGEPPPRAGHDAALGADGRVYVFGGNDGGAMLNDLWVLELAT